MQLESQPLGDGPGRVGAGVVHNGDPRLKRKLVVEVSPQPANTPLEVAFLVVDRNRDIDQYGVSLPPCGGGSGWGVLHDHQVLRHASMVDQESCRFRD